MADAPEILTLQRMKRELSIPLSVSDDDELLVGHAFAAIQLCQQWTGLPIKDMALASVPDTFTQAAVLVVRLLYDGIQDVRPTSAIWVLLAPLRVGYQSEVDQQQ